MYQSILVPLDGSKVAEAILPEIERFSGEPLPRLQLIRVCLAHGFPGQDMTDLQLKTINEARAYLQGIKSRLVEQGFDTSISVLYGDAAEEILEHSMRPTIDLVAMSTHGRSGPGRWLMGSIAEKIVRHCQKPVLLIRAGK